jgi:hypothetical protein
VAGFGTAGLAGNMVIVRKKPGNVSCEVKVQVNVGDPVVVWDYGARVQKISIRVDGISNSDAVTLSEIRRVMPQDGLERGVLMAYFAAKNEGTARLTLTIHERSATSVAVDVEVGQQ